MTVSAQFGGSLLDRFRQELARDDIVAELRAGLIGADAVIDGPFGAKPMVYADYVASGRALRQVERFVLEEVLPYYANSHTEASWCGGFMTRLRRDARAVIASHCGADEDHAVIFTGSGATAGINRLVSLFGVAETVRAGGRVRVIIGPYEHHSNILPWRESGADIVEVAEAGQGGPDAGMLADVLSETGFDLTVCAFSAASNVTGIVADVAGLTRMVKAAGALMVWDYAGGGPYLPISMTPEEGASIDAIVLSPHKFIGGPGASGVLVVRRDAAAISKPSWPGGGTVRFVTSQAHDYSGSLEAREEAGTPNVVGDIRAALSLLVKEAIGADFMQRRNGELAGRAAREWRGVENLELLGLPVPGRLPVFSFRIRDGRGGYVHQQLVTRMLSDRFGIQARGGCACAGPYVLRLLSIDDGRAQELRQAILAGDEMAKPGFTRLNFSVLLGDDKVEYIIGAVKQMAKDAADWVPNYDFDPARAIFFPRLSA